MRTDECFSHFWEYLESRRSSVDVSSPVLPRRRKVPRQFEVGMSVSENHDTVMVHYRKIYYEVIDLIMATIKNRFEQKGFLMLAKLKKILTAEKSSETDIQDIVSFYSTDFTSADALQVQLNAMHTAVASRETRLKDIYRVSCSISQVTE